MGAISLAKTTGWLDGKESEESIKPINETISLDSLASLTGFPVDFIKKELVLDSEELSIEDLRKTVAYFLEQTSQDMKVK